MDNIEFLKIYSDTIHKSLEILVMNLVGIEEKFRYYIHRSLKHKVYLPRARTNAFEYYT